MTKYFVKIRTTLIYVNRKVSTLIYIIKQALYISTSTTSPPPKKISDLLLVMKNCMTYVTIVHVLMRIKIQEQHVYYNWSKLNMYSTA